MSSLNMLETPRLLVRIDTLEDYKRIFDSYDDEALMRYFGFENEAVVETERQKVRGGFSTYRSTVQFFHIIEKASNRVIGGISYHNWFAVHSRSEIGYAMRSDAFKGQGFMKEALAPVIDYGFHHLKLNRIEAFIAPDNIPSQKLVIGQGFRQEGLLKEHINNNGVLQDSILFALLKTDYKF